MLSNMNQFFSETVSKEEFAKHVRNFMDASTLMTLENNPEIQWHRDKIKDGFYYLSEFLELLESN